MAAPILFVDDEPNVLEGLRRNLRKQFHMETAVGPHEGLKLLAERGPFAAVVSDLRMPGMSGVQFLARVRELSPDTIRIMLTGQADLGAAMAAVNQGNIFRFLTKPCLTEVLAKTLDAAIRQYELVTAERDLLEQTLRGVIEVLTDVLSLVSPKAFSRAQRIRRYVRQILTHIPMRDAWQFEIAALLSQIGCITVPSEILDRGSDPRCLCPSEREILERHPSAGHRLLAKIPRLESIARMVEQQRAPALEFDASHDAVATGAAILRTAADFDELVDRGIEPEQAILEMRGLGLYSHPLLDALESGKASAYVREFSVRDLETGMVVLEDVRARSGLLLLAKGQEVTTSVIARLEGFATTVGVVEPVRAKAWRKDEEEK